MATDFDGEVAAAEAAVASAANGLNRQHLATLYYVDGRYPEALGQLEAAFPLLRAEGHLQLAARTAIEIAQMSYSSGNVSSANGWAARARMVLERVGPCAEWGRLELVYMACDRPDIDGLLASCERALAIAIEFGDANLEAHALADGGLALVTCGRTKEGFARLDAALAAIAAGEVDELTAGICFCSMLTACDRASDVRRAREWTDLVSSIITPQGDRPRVLRTHCRVAYGSVLCVAGRWEEAEALLLAALGPADAPDRAHRHFTAAHLAGLRIDQGRLEEAADLLAPFQDRVSSCLPLARVHLARGELDLAAAVARRGISEMVSDVLRAAPLLALLVTIEIERGQVEAARAAATDLAAWAAAVDVAAVSAEAALAAARIATADGDRATAVAVLERAKALLAGDERPFQLGLVRLELAAVLAASGALAAAVDEARAALACFDRLGATAARDRAAALLRSLGDSPRTGMLPAQAVASLTRREQEVLDLIRAGLTNAEIGARLFIAAKTAEHHVGRVLTKLGVRSRAEAAALAVRAAASSSR